MTIRLTVHMRDALVRATGGPLKRVHDGSPGQPPWPAPAATLAALLRHELVDHTVMQIETGEIVETWEINDRGQEALEPPLPRHRADRARYLQREVWRGGDYTTDPAHRIDDLEVVNGRELKANWAEQAERDRAEAVIADVQQSLDEIVRQARDRNIDLTPLARNLSRRIDRAKQLVNETRSAA